MNQSVNQSESFKVVQVV